MKKMLKPPQTNKQLNEQGFASIVIALVLIVVLALFTIGFAQLARREQRSSLDKQLATQAYYAAESGINDATQHLAELKVSPPDPDTCAQLPGNPPGPVNVGGAENGVQYTCLLIDVKPPGVKYGNVQAEALRYITSSAVSSVDGSGATSLTVNWGSADDNDTFANNLNDQFAPAAEWHGKKRPAVLEFSLTPLTDLSHDNLVKNTFTAFLYPVKNGPGEIIYSAGSAGQIVAANCNTSNDAVYPCKVTIKGLTGGTGKYLFRVINHYDPSNILINGKDGAGQPYEFDGQILIDATGKAHEVSKRVQVWRPLKPSYSVPGEMLESNSTCKRFETDPISGIQSKAPTEDVSGACNFN